MRRKALAFSAVLFLVLFQMSAGFLRIEARGLLEDPFPDDFVSGSGARRKEPQTGIRIQLSEGGEDEAPSAQPPVVLSPATPLSDAETRKILERIKPIKTNHQDSKKFSLPSSTPPPPVAGKKISSSFPAVNGTEEPPQASTSTPLEVLRYSPEGSVNLASQLSVTFSHPMVALTSQEAAVSKDLPVRITPQPPGKWRWVGTKTILFEPDDRFPMATEYQVEIPAGTKSATGGVLATAKSWTFATPPPQLKTVHPGPNSGPQVRDPLVFVSFDQKIDPEITAEKIRIVGRDNAEWKVKIASDSEIAANSTVSSLAKGAQKGTWLAFRVADSHHPLPPGSSLVITLNEGAPSAEGPLKTNRAQTSAFETFGSFRATEGKCESDKCYPSSSWTIAFNNPIDADHFDDDEVRVEPPIPGLKTSAAGRTLILSGIKKANTEYKVTLKGSIRDLFGQTLGQDAAIPFQVGTSPPAIFSPDSGFVVFDPYAKPVYPVYSVNHQSLKVQLYSVGPEHWSAFQSVMDNKETALPGKLVFSETVTVNARPEELAETRIDLRSALPDGFGQVMIIVEPTAPQARDSRLQRVAAWVQVTGIGLDVFQENKKMMIWATDLKDGKPLDGVEVKEHWTGVAAGTGTDGLATLPYDRYGRYDTGVNGWRAQWLVVATRGRDIAMLPETTDPFRGRISRLASTMPDSRGRFASTGYSPKSRSPIGEEDSLRWFVFDDRHLYRPGEEVHVKGFIRRIGGGPRGDVGFIEKAVRNVTYKLKDETGSEVIKGSCRINLFGGFDLALKLPKNMNLGEAGLHLTAEGGAGAISGTSYDHSFQVEEFRRPEFEVRASSDGSLHFAGDHTEVSVTASYYVGGPLPEAPVRWWVKASPRTFTPPNRRDFTFGRRVPWRGYGSSLFSESGETFNGKTDATGKHRLRMDLLPADFPSPVKVEAEANVSDVNRQTWTASATMLVHPSNVYIGLRSPRTFVQKGQPLIIQSIATDLDGKAVPGREIQLRVVRLDRVFKKGEWSKKELDAQEHRIASAADPVECRFETKEGGEYRITAVVEDEHNRRNMTELTVWVAGGASIVKQEVTQEEVAIIPDREEYQPGDTAELLIQAPFLPAEGLMTLRRGGIVRTETFLMTEPSTVLKVPIEDCFIPNLYIQVDLVGTSARADDSGEPDARLPKRPACATGKAYLAIPPSSRALTVKATPRASVLEPGGTTVVDVEVKDASSRPVSGSEVALVVADEAVLGLIDYRIDDPIEVFYPERLDGSTKTSSRAELMLANPEDLVSEGKGSLDPRALDFWTRFPGGMTSYRRWLEFVIDKRESMFMKHMKGGEGGPEIRMRQDFNPLAIFAPSLKTDARGRVEVKVKAPDNLTRYRVTAVAVAGEKRFGFGESAITARLPVMVRPSAPRFLNFGDRFELSAVVQNQTDAPIEADVVLRASNLELPGGAGRHVRAPAHDRVEVRFPASASKPGTARFQLAAVSGRWSDAAEISLPVYTPATTEAFAAYGEIDEGMMVQPIQAPPDVVKDFGGLEIEMSSTQLQALTDALLYLTAYPFECSEQLASRILAVASLRDVLRAFRAEGLPKPEEMAAAVERDIDRLKNRRSSDGGFGLWDSRKSIPYVSIFVTHALQRAKDKGFKTPEDMLEDAAKYLKGIEQRIPAGYSPMARKALIAYSLYVRNLMGDPDRQKARNLIAESGLDGLSMEAVGWLLRVLTGDPDSAGELSSIRRHIGNRVSEEAGTAQFTTSYGEACHLLLHSARRTDAVVLEALMADQPGSDLIPKIVRGLLAHRVKGHWMNTQENTFVLQALDAYFAAYEKATPDFQAIAWIGSAFAGAHPFKGRSADRRQVQAPMSFLADHPGSQNLILQKEGAGRLYYRLGLRYAPSNLKLDPADHGFTVQRAYEPVDAKEDVQRASDGAWLIRSGARVRVRLTMEAPARRYHVALVDHLPAGLEALNTALSATGSLPEDEVDSDDNSATSHHWFRRWFEHENLRDDRAEVFSSILPAGVYNYSCIARATTPGEFIAPPAKAEEMYHPETFGRGSTDRVIIK